MARTPEGKLLTDLHRRQQLALRASVVRDVMKLWPAWQPSKPDSYQAFERAMVLLVQSRSVQSAAISARYYEMFRAVEAPVSKVLRTVPLAVSRSEAEIRAALGATTRGSVYRSLAAGQAFDVVMRNCLVNVSGTVSRDVLAGGRDTIAGEVQRDPQAQHWARVTGANPCAFCAMLASRGPVYGSAESAGAGEEWHIHCDCTQEVEYEGYEWNARSLRQQEQWNESDGTLNGFRQDLNKTPDKTAALSVDASVAGEAAKIEPYIPSASNMDVAASLKEGYGVDANLRGLSAEDANALGQAVHNEVERGGPLSVRGVRSGTPGNGAIADWDPSSHQMHYSGGRMAALGEPSLPTAAGEVARLESLATEWADAAAASPRNARVLAGIEKELGLARAALSAGRTPLPFNAFHYAADRRQLVEWLWTHELAHSRLSQRGDLADRVAGWFNFGKPKYPSDYARHDFGEWWAESFSLWRGGRGDLIDPRLHDLFEKEFAK